MLRAVGTGAGTAQLVENGPGRFRVEGELTLATAAALAAAGARLARAARNGATVEVDLSGVDRSSSAAVALLLDWTDQVRRAGGEVRFLGWPEAIVRIAEFSNVAGLLGIAVPARAAA